MSRIASFQGRPWCRRARTSCAVVVALGIIIGCGDSGSGPEPRISIEGSSALRMTFVGEQTQLRVTNGGASVQWVSTASAVAEVDRDGVVTAAGNGIAFVIARAADGAADSVRVTVEPEIAQLTFLGPLDHAVRNEPFLRPVRIAVVDRGGTPIAGSAVPVRVTLDGGMLAGTVTKVASNGLATFDDLVISTAGAAYVIEATNVAGTLLAVSNPFDVVEAADQVRAQNAGEVPLGLLIDGAAASGFVNDVGRVAQDSAVDIVLGAGAGTGEVIGFMRGRPPMIANAPWTDAPDTIAFSFPDPIAIPVTVWVVKGPFAQQRDRAASAIATTSLIWDDQMMGLAFSEIEYIDATADPDAAAFFDLTLCNEQSQMTTQIGKRAGRINIYYVGTVDGGTDRGRACGGGDFTMMAERSGHELLAHEIGHLFSLGHVDNDDAFDRTNVMHSASSTRRYLTEGQVLRSHYNAFSALRVTYASRTDPERTCSDGLASFRCPALERRLFADGDFPADGPASPVEEWLLTTCTMEADGGAARPALDARATSALIAALEGPPRRLVDDVVRQADRRTAEIRRRLDAGASFGLDGAALAGLRASLAAPQQTAEEFRLRYRLAAIRGLGEVGGERATDRLRSIAADPASPLAAAARSALGR